MRKMWKLSEITKRFTTVESFLEHARKHPLAEEGPSTTEELIEGLYSIGFRFDFLESRFEGVSDSVMGTKSYLQWCESILRSIE